MKYVKVLIQASKTIIAVAIGMQLRNCKYVRSAICCFMIAYLIDGDDFRRLSMKIFDASLFRLAAVRILVLVYFVLHVISLLVLTRYQLVNLRSIGDACGFLTGCPGPRLAPPARPAAADLPR